jgi:hypothetical protein
MSRQLLNSAESSGAPTVVTRAGGKRIDHSDEPAKVMFHLDVTNEDGGIEMHVPIKKQLDWEEKQGLIEVSQQGAHTAQACINRASESRLAHTAEACINRVADLLHVSSFSVHRSLVSDRVNVAG